MIESLYSVKQIRQNSEKVDELGRVFDLEPICHPRTIQQAVHIGTSTKYHQISSSGTESGTSEDMTLSDHSMYVDSDISDELRLKVTCSLRDSNNTFVSHSVLSTLWPGCTIFFVSLVKLMLFV